MKRSARILAILLVCAVGLATAALAAGTYTKTLTAYYQDIKLRINNQLVVPKDVDGNVVDPFIIDGTTYLPVRAVSEALGKKVDWDGTTNTVLISDPQESYEGTWRAVKASASGLDTPVETVFPQGFVLRLMANGAGTTDLAGETFDITWKQDNGALTVTYSESFHWFGSITGSVMVLNIEGTFVTLVR